MRSAPTKAARKRENINKESELKQARLPGFRATSSLQKELYQSCLESPMVIATGPAGSGKSFTMVYAACYLFVNGLVDKIIVTRNPVPTGTSLGFFQGDKMEKMLNWMGPVIGTFKKILRNPNGGDGWFAYLVEKGFIEFLPIETLKGSSFDRSVVLIEESQEADMEVLKMLATRIGEGSKVFFNGDLKQSNKKVGGNGFNRFVEAIKQENGYSQWVADPNQEWDKIHIPVVEFTIDDIVRSPLTRKMVSIIEKYEL